MSRYLVGIILHTTGREFVRFEESAEVSGLILKGKDMSTYEYCLYSVPSPPFSRSILNT
jgi:hypothetical protein